MLRLTVSKPKKRKFPPRPKASYQLEEVRQKIQNGNVRIAGNAYAGAFRDFGWGKQDIFDVYMRLKNHHFYKTESSKLSRLTMIDFYKIRYMGEDVYTHFYINDYSGELVINSFKQDRGEL